MRAGPIGALSIFARIDGAWIGIRAFRIRRAFKAYVLVFVAMRLVNTRVGLLGAQAVEAKFFAVAKQFVWARRLVLSEIGQAVSESIARIGGIANVFVQIAAGRSDRIEAAARVLLARVTLRIGTRIARRNALIEVFVTTLRTGTVQTVVAVHRDTHAKPATVACV